MVILIFTSTLLGHGVAEVAGIYSKFFLLVLLKFQVVTDCCFVVIDRERVYEYVKVVLLKLLFKISEAKRQETLYGLLVFGSY